ncbi:MAG: hypothetical protein WD076_02655, partial [Parvularculaceae bacterium]
MKRDVSSTRATSVNGIAQRGGALRSAFLFLALLALLAAASIGAGGYFAYREAARQGPLDQPTIVLLKAGTSVSSIGKLLQTASVIRYPELFVAVVRVKRLQSKLKAGEYQFPAGASILGSFLVRGDTAS